MQAGRIAPRTLEREQYLLSRFIFPSLGKRPVAKVTPIE